MDLTKILKNVPRGTKLYSVIHGELTFAATTNDLSYPINCIINNRIINFTKEGKYVIGYDNGECVLFPSKENRDWNDFVYNRYPLNTPVMVSDCSERWHLRYYAYNNKCFIAGLKKNNNIACRWKYIIPVEEFDFVNQKRKDC